MNIVIIGAGALGKCIAGLLEEQAMVKVYERNPHARQVLMHGSFIFKENRSTKKVSIQSVASLKKLQGEKIDILIFATKIMDLRKAVVQSAGLDPRYIFFPQNGIFDICWAKRFYKTAGICRGVTTMACQESGPGEVKLFYRGNVYVGGDGAPLIADLFRKAGVGSKVCRNSEGAVWAKLIFSAVMNPLPVVTEQGYSVLSSDKEIWNLVRKAVEEGKAVARALGVRLSFDPMRLIYRVRNGDLVGIEHKGSIVHDMRVGRLTELDCITGALIRHARKAGMKTPALDSILHRARLAGA